ncbi:DUF551 domain-containing protein [Rhodocyclus tenuis]|uniref:DUF551 domain-containing protein n=1 Tax=Rhodocyclus tenuis TaxID=1066 RepID=A0A840GFG7_RHOTE|nr:DUF551 domain-containing protein [Rhodocyclus tenuis]MBB4247282.1 hypothetical protein [Rhodocyclus tenuis]
MKLIGEIISWRSVEDALPDADESVLIAGDYDAPVWIGFLGYEMVWFDASTGEEIDSPHHWAPLPDGPGAPQ